MKHHRSAAALAALLFVQSSSALAIKSHQIAFSSLSPHPISRTALTASTIDELPSDTTVEDPETLLTSRNRLVALASTLSSNSATGRFISRPADKIKLQKAINELESLSGSMGPKERDLMIGDWTLLVTAYVANSDVRRRFGDTEQTNSWLGKGRSGISLFGRDGLSLDPLQKTIRKSIEVTQRIRDMDNNGEINRVDNVIEFTPLDTLSDVIPKESPLAFLAELNVNPLQVKKGKAVLIHKAEVESVAPVLRTKISWTSSVLNVAGTSQFFEPDGSDVFGVNNLLGEFLNTGTFETPYIDEDIRISRTRGPVFEQLRVFVRKGSDVMHNVIIDSIEAELRVEEEMEVGASTARAESRVQKLVDAAQDIGGAVSSIGKDVRSAVEKDLEVVSDALGDAMDNVVNKVQDVVEEDLKDLSKSIEGVQKSLQGEGELRDAVANVTKAVAKVPQDVRNAVKNDAAVVNDSVGEALDTMVKDVQDVVEDDIKKLDASVSDVRDVLLGENEDDGTSDEKKQ
ncbi:hypothetical protein ACHAXN_001680 [Cyclotella atomus]